MFVKACWLQVMLAKIHRMSNVFLVDSLCNQYRNRNSQLLGCVLPPGYEFNLALDVSVAFRIEKRCRCRITLPAMNVYVIQWGCRKWPRHRDEHELGLVLCFRRPRVHDFEGTLARDQKTLELTNGVVCILSAEGTRWYNNERKKYNTCVRVGEAGGSIQSICCISEIAKDN